MGGCRRGEADRCTRCMWACSVTVSNLILVSLDTNHGMPLYKKLLKNVLNKYYEANCSNGTKNVVQSYFFSTSQKITVIGSFLSPADLCKVVRACLDNCNTLYWFPSMLLPELLAYYPRASQPTMAPCEVSHSFQNVTTDFLSNNPQDFTHGCW